MKMKIGFLGCGNLAQTIIYSWIEKKVVEPSDILVANRSPAKLQKIVQDLGIGVAKNNEDMLENSEIIILAVKPQDLETALEPINSIFDPSQRVISLAAGVQVSRIQKLLPQGVAVARVMTNTATRFHEGMTGYHMNTPHLGLKKAIEYLFSPLGQVLEVPEGEAFQAFTVATSSGVGFVIELMLYWQEWLEEYGFEPEQAQSMVIQTFLGASHWVRQMKMPLTDLQSKVVSKKGITAAGLDSMRELEVERLLRYSFEKAILRDRELSNT